MCFVRSLCSSLGRLFFWWGIGYFQTDAWVGLLGTWFAFLIVLGRHRFLCWLTCVVLVSISTFYMASVSFVVILSSHFRGLRGGHLYMWPSPLLAPGFNRGKNAPGGGRGSRSPPGVATFQLDVRSLLITPPYRRKGICGRHFR